MAHHRLQRRKPSRRRKGDQDLHRVHQEGDGGAEQEVAPQEGDPLGEEGHQQGKDPHQGVIEEGEAGPEVEGGGGRDRR